MNGPLHLCVHNAGGKVVVFTGLLELVQNEPQLASVLAHEIAHVLARHTVSPNPKP